MSHSARILLHVLTGSSSASLDKACFTPPATARRATTARPCGRTTAQAGPTSWRVRWTPRPTASAAGRRAARSSPT